MASKTSEIKLSIELDQENIPHKIRWEAQGGQTSRLADAFHLYIWDSQDKAVYNMEMWTKDMLVDDMKLAELSNLSTDLHLL